MPKKHKFAAFEMHRSPFRFDQIAAKHGFPTEHVSIEALLPIDIIKSGFHTVKSELVDAPIILEQPMAVECQLVSYDPETCRMVGEVVNI